MPEVVGILGANGVYARHLIPRLVAARHRVVALARRPEAATVALASGCDVRPADIFDCSSMTRALEGCTMAINLATSLPGPSGRGDFAANDKLRVEGAPNWINACSHAGVKQIIQQSISFGYGGDANAWGDETTKAVFAEDTIATRAIAASQEMEDVITSSELDWLILRGGLFYGPGTGMDDGWHERAKLGKLRLPGDGSSFVSLVHIADMAEATVRAVNRFPSREAVIVCDDEPSSWRDILNYVCALHGQPPAVMGAPEGFPSFRLRNSRAKTLLDWKPTYSSWRTGLIR